MAAIAVDPDLLAKKDFNGHSCFGIVQRVTVAEQVEVLILKAIENGVLKLEFPGGTGISGESVQATLARELSTEISQGDKPVEIRETVEIKRNLRRGDAAKGGGVHTQYFFLILFAFAKPLVLRTEEKEEPDGTLLYPPTWVEIGDFIRDQKTKYAHRDAAIVFIRYLAGKSRGICLNYQEFMRG